MNCTIYHNPQCGTSRNALAMLRASGENPSIIEYLKKPLHASEIKQLLEKLNVGVRSILREKGTLYAELGLDDDKLSDKELIAFIEKYPILLNRPIVITDRGAKLCRPSEEVISLLVKPLPKDFVKGDGKPPTV